jgi:hypothetical protein
VAVAAKDVVTARQLLFTQSTAPGAAPNDALIRLPVLRTAGGDVDIRSYLPASRAAGAHDAIAGMLPPMPMRALMWHVRDAAGETPLHVAARLGSTVVLGLSSAADAHPATYGNHLHRAGGPEHAAARYGRGDALGWLLDNGGHADARDSWGHTPLDWVMQAVPADHVPPLAAGAAAPAAHATLVRLQMARSLLSHGGTTALPSNRLFAQLRAWGMAGVEMRPLYYKVTWLRRRGLLILRKRRRQARDAEMDAQEAAEAAAAAAAEVAAAAVEKGARSVDMELDDGSAAGADPTGVAAAELQPVAAAAAGAMDVE